MNIGRKKLNEIDVKPLRFYREQFINIEDVEIGDVVLAHVHDVVDETILLRVADIEATMELNDFCDFPEPKNIKSAKSFVGRNVLVTVKDIQQNGLILERRSILDETTNILKTKIGEVVDATVLWIMSYGLFVDLGNGVISIILSKEVAKSRFNFFNIFAKGERVKVKILDYDSEKNHFIISRKQAYETVTFDKNELIEVRCSTPLSDGTGIFVEYDPGNSGIMDIPYWRSPKSFAEGERVIAIVKRMAKNGFRCTFYGWDWKRPLNFRGC